MRPGRPGGGEAGRASASLAELAASWRSWLLDAAAPIWASEGVLASGGFADSIGWDGRATGSPLRARVQARQVYVFATLGALGWSGPWRRLTDDGAAFIARAFARPDGLYRTGVALQGAPVDDTATLYDQAFFLFAAAAHAKAADATQRQALARCAQVHLERIEAHFGHPASGFREAATGQPFQSNPHMHLLEAALAWEEVDGDACWVALADRVVALCLSRFIDKDSGALRELFAENWSPAPGEDRIEPGHQFEWAWLLARWGRSRGHAGAQAAAARLFRIGLDHGVDAGRGVAFGALDDRMRTRDPVARLWPQTERIKAALSLGGEARDAEVAAACAGLQRFTQVTPAGLWRDKMLADGSFVQEPAPASSFYHIVCALNELFAAA